MQCKIKAQRTSAPAAVPYPQHFDTLLEDGEAKLIGSAVEGDRDELRS